MPDVGVERSDGVATLTLRAPERRNALTVEMAAEMVAACEQLDADPAVGAVIVCGEGDYFCAGGDRATLAAAGEDPGHPDRYRDLGTIYRAFTRVAELEPPTIAAVEGGAVGAGMNLLLATDLRIISADARLASGFLPIGLHPGGGHTAMLAERAGREAASALALFGERIDGRRAAEIGLAWASVEPGTTLQAATELAAVPGSDPELARATARSLRNNAGPPAIPWATALEAERSSQIWSMRRAAIKRGD